MTEINPYIHPLDTGDKIESLEWEIQRIQWQINKLKNIRVIIGMHVIFIVPKKLSILKMPWYLYQIDKGTKAIIDRDANDGRLFISLERNKHTYSFRAYSYYLYDFDFGDILPGFLATDEDFYAAASVDVEPSP